MNEEIAGLARFIVDVCADIHLVFTSLPESFMVPAAYFIPCELRGERNALAGSEMNIRQFVKIYHSSSELAAEYAGKIAWALSKARNLVPLYSRDGSSLGYGFKLRRVETKIVGIGQCQLWLEWLTMYPAEEEPKNVEEFIFTMEGKS